MENTPKENHYIVILCGGTGPRLWPLSRASNPKQFLELFDKGSLLEQTIKRAIKITSPRNIFIITNKNYFDKVSSISKKYISEKNIISEPLKKNTTLAILYASAVIKNKNPNAIISTFPSDHYIKNIDKFKRDIIKAKTIAKKNDSIVTIGIKPTSPNPAYGYILPKHKIENYLTVDQFIEKPNPENAKKLIKRNAFWNSGIYTFSISTLETEFNKLQPEFYKSFFLLEQNLNNKQKIEDLYLNSQDIAIDKSISEKSHHMLVIQATFDWSDVGEWNAIYFNSNKDKNGNALINKNTQFSVLNSSNCLISGASDKLIGLVGVNNLAIIETPDALLVCNLDDSFSVRDLVSSIIKNKSTASYFLTQK